MPASAWRKIARPSASTLGGVIDVVEGVGLGAPLGEHRVERGAEGARRPTPAGVAQPQAHARARRRAGTTTW